MVTGDRYLDMTDLTVSVTDHVARNQPIHGHHAGQAVR
ncbi:hypothetical protein I551_3485 [Mycobacterium ulcerans str. Harvey]|uniref:Uncharacterized protein n=1 Tax=Mycobacterium ulcerans str. Harvey TaxID=1299332 RepID=A0ABP3AFG0_MYCUL|nr:hypothetical protein I551_3485 [Mycobacterium ulcerans str. Harvey]